MKLRSFARAVLVLIAVIVVVPLATVVAINARDEDLSALAKAQLAVPQVAVAGNGAAALWALDAPRGVDAATVGETVYRAVEAAALDQPTRTEWPVRRPYAGADYRFPATLACSDAQSACVATFLAHADATRAEAARVDYLLARVAAIDGPGPWHELPPPASPSPNAPLARLADLSGLYSLSLGVAACDISDGHFDRGIGALEVDVRIARRIMRESESLLSKMVATGMLRRALLTYSELLSINAANPRARAALAQSIERVGHDLSPLERDLAAPLRYEARTLRVLVLQLTARDLEGGKTVGEKAALIATPLFFKANATTNLQAGLLAQEAPLMSADTGQFATDAAGVSRELAARGTAIADLDWHSLYNPLGKTLAAQAPDLVGAAARVHDDAVLMRAVRVKALFLTRPVAYADAAAALIALPESLFDPYRAAAFNWSAADSALVLTQLGSHPVGQVAIPLAAKS